MHPLVSPTGIDGLRISGLTLVRPAFWTVHLVFSSRVHIDGLNISTFGFPNGDGVDVDSSSDVLIEDTVFDTGDDCIAVKAGLNANGRAVGVTVRTKPNNAGIASCVSGQIRGMSFPAHPRLDVTSTVFKGE